MDNIQIRAYYSEKRGLSLHPRRPDDDWWKRTFPQMKVSPGIIQIMPDGKECPSEVLHIKEVFSEKPPHLGVFDWEGSLVDGAWIGKWVEVFHLAVWYGEAGRWEYETLKKSHDLVGEFGKYLGCDGLQADYEFRDRAEAIAAHLRLQEAGIGSQTGDMGRGPTEEALREARGAMGSAYKKMYPTMQGDPN